MDNPIQPLAPHFVRSTVWAFGRFVVLHPLLVCGTLCIQYSLLFLWCFAMSSHPLDRQALAPFVLAFQHVAFVLVLAPLSLSFLQSQKSAELTSNIRPLSEAIGALVLKDALPLGSKLNWAPTVAIIVVTLLGMSLWAGVTGAVPRISQTPPNVSPSLYWSLVILLYSWFLLPFIWLAFGVFLVPRSVYSTLLCTPHQGGWFKVFPYYMVTATMLNPEQAPIVASRIIEANSRKLLIKLWVLWLIARFFANILGLAALLDSFAFAALLHASLGGKLNPATSQAQSTGATPLPQPAAG